MLSPPYLQELLDCSKSRLCPHPQSLHRGLLGSSPQKAKWIFLWNSVIVVQWSGPEMSPTGWVFEHSFPTGETALGGEDSLELGA